MGSCFPIRTPDSASQHHPMYALECDHLYCCVSFLIFEQNIDTGALAYGAELNATSTQGWHYMEWRVNETRAGTSNVCKFLICIHSLSDYFVLRIQLFMHCGSLGATGLTINVLTTNAADTKPTGIIGLPC